MKKSIAAVSFVLMLVMCLPMVSFAASPVAPLPATVNVEGSSVPTGATLRVTQAPAGVVANMQAAQDTLGLEGTLIAVLDISLTGATGAATIRVECPGLYANGSVKVLHQTANGVEEIWAVCGEGYFTFTADSFSPFGFVLLSAGSAPSGPSSNPTSPQTGVYSL